MKKQLNKTMNLIKIIVYQIMRLIIMDIWLELLDIYIYKKVLVINSKMLEL